MICIFPDKSRVGLYIFDKCNGLTDLAGNGNDGTYYMTCEKYVMGPPDIPPFYVRTFCGNGYAEIPNNGALNTRRSMSIVFWYMSFEPQTAPILNHAVDTNRAVRCWHLEPNVMSCAAARADGKVERNDIVQASVLDSNQWYKVVFVYDFEAKQSTLYINGGMYDKKETGQQLLSTAGKLRMGAVDGFPGNLNGAVACLQIFTRPFNATDVEEIDCSLRKLCL